MMIVDVVSIPREFDFEQLSRAITGEEAYRYKFQGNEIKTGKEGQYNEASFDFYADGPYPPDCVVQPASQAAPAGYSVEWSGRMLVQNRVRQVVLYRADA
jgi:hypothetical protein